LTSGGANMPWFPAGKFCAPGFQDKCDTEWVGTGVPTVAAVNLSIVEMGYGFTTEPGNYPTDFAPTYQGTAIIFVPAAAKGTYTLGFVEAETFLQELNEGTGETVPILIAAYRPGVIDIPCGKCCYGVGTPSDGCIDSLSASECAAQPAVAIFTAGDTCDAPPSAEGCCACLTNADCNDGDACTTDICNSCVCSNTDNASWDKATECCNSATGVETLLGCPDQCQSAQCPARGSWRGGVHRSHWCDVQRRQPVHL
jgi:hypothetical protein